MVMTNDEAVAMIAELRATRHCDNCVKQADYDEQLCCVCLKTADKYYYEEKPSESSD
jgi:predicted amidophosphoribosyltransferase